MSFENLFLTLINDTFYTLNTHLDTSMVELIKPSWQAKIGSQNLFFIMFYLLFISLRVFE